MKKLLLIFGWWLTLTAAQAEPLADTLFARANRAFMEGDYAGAAGLYQQIIDTGYVSPAVYYNLGNAWFRNNRLADAILNYERALLLNPGDQDVRFNLELANSYVKDKIEVLPVPFFSRWHRNLVSALPPGTWGWISLGTFFFAFLFFSLYLFFSRPSLRRLGFWLAMVLFFVSVSAFVFAREHHGKIHGKHSAIVYQPVVTVKSTPDESGTDLFVLHEGTKVGLLDELGDWQEIKISDGNKGWVPRASIKTI